MYSDEVQSQAEQDWQQLQSINYSQTEVYDGDKTDRPDTDELRKKKLELYDRMETQWTLFAELGFVLTAFTGTCALITFLRVFGAGLLAGSVALVAVLAGAMVLLCFWRELSASQYKARVLFCLFSLGCGLVLSLSDQAIDMARHYSPVLQSAIIAGGVTSLALFGVVLLIKYNSPKRE